MARKPRRLNSIFIKITKKHPMADLRTPKGTRDYGAKECFELNKFIKYAVKIFEKHGAVCIDTPTFELKNILCNKYGEDSKLIFDLADQGGDISSLRYDLTVSFARYLAKNKIKRIKRFQIGKVFRRDQPSFAKGRLREFIQCDFDIAGAYIDMLPDAEAIRILCECLDGTGIAYRVRLNSRLILNSIIECAGIKNNLFMAVCSSIDKIDKLSWKEITDELCSKGLTLLEIKKLEEYVGISGEKDVIERLKKTELYLKDSGKRGIEELEKLWRYLEIYGVCKHVIIDLSLARGLEYYTGIIFEAFFIEYKEIGSIAGGGRYDNLVSSILNKASNGSFDVPCIGFSLGMIRILSILLKKNSLLSYSTIKVFVGSSGSLLLEERLNMLRILWDNDIPAETFYTKRYNFASLLENVISSNIPFFIVLGESELKRNKIKLLYGDDKKEQVVEHLDHIIGLIKANLGIQSAISDD